MNEQVSPNEDITEKKNFLSEIRVHGNLFLNFLDTSNLVGCIDNDVFDEIKQMFKINNWGYSEITFRNPDFLKRNFKSQMNAFGDTMLDFLEKAVKFGYMSNDLLDKIKDSFKKSKVG